MDNKKIGEFISTLRKSNNLTQKDLADQLGITDKAVSKWERGAGYPDISMLRPLADILGTSVSELLEGEVLEAVPETAVMNIDCALNYADKIITFKENKLGKIISAIFTICLFIGIFTSVIVNIALDSNLTWSVIVIASCVLGGCILIPPFLWKLRGFYLSLALLTILIIPFLKIIEYETAIISGYGGWLWKLGFPISLTWLIIIWIMIFLIRKIKISKWFYISISAIVCIFGTLITNHNVDQYLGLNSFETSKHISSISTISNVICLLTIAGICFVIGLMKKNNPN